MNKYLSPNDPLLIIIGPSGSGKSSLARNLAQQGTVEITPSWTTRPMRSGENRQNIEHYFASDEEFTAKEQQGFFIETATLFGLPYRYGLPKITAPQQKRVPVIILRANLINLARKHYPYPSIYQIEDSLENIRIRLQKRQANGDIIGSRFADYEPEITLGRTLANRLFINDSIESLSMVVGQSILKDFSRSL